MAVIAGTPIGPDRDRTIGSAATARTDEDTVVGGTLLASDPDSDTLTYALVAPVAGVTVAADGTWSYDPRGRHDALSPGQSDTVSFSFTASTAVSQRATVTITVTGLDDAPTVSGPASATVKEGDLVRATFVATDLDLEKALAFSKHTRA